jgi:hypothetical protein
VEDKDKKDFKDIKDQEAAGPLRAGAVILEG